MNTPLSTILLLPLVLLLSCAPGAPLEKKTAPIQQREVVETQIIDPKYEEKLKAQPEQKEPISANLLVEARFGNDAKIFVKAAFFKPVLKNPLFPNALVTPSEDEGEHDHKGEDEKKGEHDHKEDHEHHGEGPHKH